jgi:type II secretory ATPase GspE/PulE/Tfp pilus assembly ATPase PilB-like protein
MPLEKIKVTVPNSLLGNNDYYIQFLVILYVIRGYDLLFICARDRVMIKVKAPAGWHEIISRYYPHWNPRGEILDYISKIDYDKLLFQIKLGLGMNLTEPIIQNKGSRVFFNGEYYGLRLSIHPSNNGENLSLRMLHPVKTYQEHNLALLSGINLIVGPTCSGKTTLLYKIIQGEWARNQNIISLEDPVEKQLSCATQTDVSIIGYDRGLESALRQNPDIICIGEIRNEISAKAAFRAALTGHKVVTTLHSLAEDNPIENMKHCYLRLRELGIPISHIEQLTSQIIFCKLGKKPKVIAGNINIKRLHQAARVNNNLSQKFLEVKDDNSQQD